MSAVFYLDSSALVKLAVQEAESDALRGHLGRSQVVASVLVRTELMRAVMGSGKEANVKARAALKKTGLVAISEKVLDAAGELPPVVLRSLDAIHLATALQLGDDVKEVVTYDRRMVAAAEALGMRVVSPGQ